MKKPPFSVWFLSLQANSIDTLIGLLKIPNSVFWNVLSFFSKCVYLLHFLEIFDLFKQKE